jgi:hypothetical protein
MMELERKGKYGVTHIFEANMGNRTINTIRDHSGKRTGPTYANEILEGNLVKITGPNQVAKCAAGDTPIGIAMKDYDHEGAIPTTNGTWGSYDNNAIISVETFARVIETVQLEATNSKIVAGDKIKVGTTTPGCYDKGTSSNNAVALEDAAANSGAKIKVAFGVMEI